MYLETRDLRDPGQVIFHEKACEVGLVLRFSNTAALFSMETRRTILKIGKSAASIRGGGIRDGMDVPRRRASSQAALSPIAGLRIRAANRSLTSLQGRWMRAKSLDQVQNSQKEPLLERNARTVWTH